MGLDNGIAVFAEVRASNSGGMSDWVAANASDTPTAVRPSAPTGLMVTQSGGTTLTVSWMPPSNDGGATGGITGYDVEETSQADCTSGWTDATTEPATVGASATMAMITGLTNGDSHCVRVVANRRHHHWHRHVCD